MHSSSSIKQYLGPLLVVSGQPEGNEILGLSLPRVRFKQYAFPGRILRGARDLHSALAGPSRSGAGCGCAAISNICTSPGGDEAIAQQRTSARSQTAWMSRKSRAEERRSSKRIRLKSLLR